MIWQRTHKERYPRKNIIWQRKLSNNKADNSVKVNRELFLLDLLGDLRPDVRGQDFHQSLAGELPHQVVLGGNKVIWAFLANMLNILSRFIDIPQVVKSWFKVVSIQSVALQIAIPNCVLGSGSEKVLLERLSLFPEQIAAEIPQWQVLNNLKWSQLSKQLSSSQTFPQL